MWRGSLVYRTSSLSRLFGPHNEEVAVTRSAKRGGRLPKSVGAKDADGCRVNQR
ncbi:hypothetical protein CLV47_11131 [Antricoccus suffuscus]|uniref:Uncharacterized protein n=1 Tax=Antricoccus suffuscus TaxID=1629062 RepID=A0A2T0ZXS5_9ACTN|nr:hypothetical protein CLV47_11131 [Antricoccus suffuscus]